MENDDIWDVEESKDNIKLGSIRVDYDREIRICKIVVDGEDIIEIARIGKKNTKKIRFNKKYYSKFLDLLYSVQDQL
jgi:hypothetical protein